MARYTDDSKERVRTAVDMVDLVGTRAELRRAGATRYEGLCPFCDERTPSFGINLAEKLFYCFGCGEGGDAFKFVQLTEGVEFKGALEFLADRYGVQLEVVEEDPAAAERRRAHGPRAALESEALTLELTRLDREISAARAAAPATSARSSAAARISATARSRWRSSRPSRPSDSRPPVMRTYVPARLAWGRGQRRRLGPHPTSHRVGDISL